MKFERIFEPQLASHPFARKMSLWAIGTPVKACARPAARARSASAACSRLRSSSSAMKQLYFGFNALMRWRKPWTASTLESSRAASASERALSVRECITAEKSLYDFWHEIEAALHARRSRLEEFVLVGFRDAILTQPKGHVLRVRHRLDPAHVDRLHFFDQTEDAGEL